jgi:hypothetical protein
LGGVFWTPNFRLVLQQAFPASDPKGAFLRSPKEHPFPVNGLIIPMNIHAPDGNHAIWTLRK